MQKAREWRRNNQEQRIRRKNNRNKRGVGDKTREELDSEGASAWSTADEQRIMALVPSKTDLTEMFTELENVIKAEISNVRADMGHLLRRVEEVKEVSGTQAKEISDLKDQVSKMRNENRTLAFRLEEQENQSR